MPLSTAEHNIGRRSQQKILALAAALSEVSDEDDRITASLRYGRLMPSAIQDQLATFRLSDNRAFTVWRNASGLFADVGPTPSHWRVGGLPGSRVAESILLLYASLVGDVFGWSTQQDGSIVHDVLPIFADANEQVGSGSLVELSWHTEDAFHIHRPDYVVLLALRNDGHVATTVGTLSPSTAQTLDLRTLMSERYHIVPDESHSPGKNSSTAAGLFDEIVQMHAAPQKVAALYGDASCPYVRLDPDFMAAAPGDHAAGRALSELYEAIERSIVDVVLHPGDVLVLNNHRAVHGRRRFQASFDGSDRWLKRVLVSRNLIQSRHLRPANRRTIGHAVLVRP